jgi:hypothetical protein
MTPQPPRESGAKSTTPPAASTGTTPVVRRYPKPPGLPRRLALFCLKPESWPAAARYPSRFTFIPLILAIVLSAAIIGAADGVRFARNLSQYAAALPALEINSDGILKYKEPRTEPVRFKFSRGQIVLDPANTSNIDVSKTPNTYLITDRDFVVPGAFGTETHYPLSTLPSYGIPLPEKGKTATFDAASLRNVAPGFGIGLAFVVALGQCIGDLLWAAMMMFFVSPLITLVASVGDRSLILPRRAAYRMAAALLIPLIIFNAAMHLAGYPIADAFGGGGEIAWLIFFGAAAALAVWTGIMARHMFGPRRRLPAARG